MNRKNIWAKTISIFSNIKEIIENINNENIGIEEKKGIGNFVTNLDKQLEEHINTSLLELFPKANIISEESSNKQIKKDGLNFIVDPLDGTTNYINGWPHTIAIGVVDNNELVCGFVYDVLERKIYSAIKDEGVLECSIDDISNQKLVEKPEYKDEIPKSVICHDTPYGAEAFKTTLELYRILYTEKASTKTIGPISLDVLKSALGRKNRPKDYEDAVWHTEVRAWDLAAATCILREFGGDIIDCDTGKSISTDVLTDPKKKIAFIASGSEKLRNAIYNKYIEASKKVSGLDIINENYVIYNEMQQKALKKTYE